MSSLPFILPDAPDLAAHFSVAFQNAPSFFAIFRGRDLVFVAANDACYQIVGHRELIGKRFLDALPEIRGYGFDADLLRVMESGVPHTGREVHVQLQRIPDGPMEERVVDFTFLPLVDGGDLPGVIAHGYDVTEKVRARIALEQARDRAEQLYSFTTDLSLAPTLVAVADAVVAGSQRAFPESVGTIIVGRAPDVEELEILSVSELPGQIFENWQRFPISLDAPLAEAVRTRHTVLLESRDDWERRYPHLTQLLAETGHRAQIIAPLIVGGECTGAIGIAFDRDRAFTDEETQFAVSIAQQCAIAMERVRLFGLEQEARNAAEKASFFKTEFLAGLSHELRTPLNAIGGYAELLEMEIHGPVSPEQRTALERIQTSRKHVQGLIDSVLELTRIESGATHYSIEQVSLGETITVCEALMAPQITAKGLQYSRSGTVDGMTVWADAEKLRQIILNLLTNAVKYTETGGVSLSVERVHDLIAMKVTDTGSGIDPSKLELIFQPFVQLNERAAPQTGVGLGLAISRNLARGMGGDLTAHSEPGKGSAFTLTLPALV